MNKELQEQTQEQMFETCLMGHEDAIKLAYQLADISHFYDDVIDGDPFDRGDVYRILYTSMIEIHYNPFWQQYNSELLPILNRGISDWIASNDIEQEGESDLMHVSMIKKSAFTPVFLHMCQLIGGVSHERDCAKLVYRFVFDETLDEYKAEHGVS